MAYPKSFSAYPLFGGTQWPFALKAFRKVDVAGVIHDIGHFGTAYSRIYLVLLFPDFDSLKIPFFLRSDNQYIVKSADFSG